MRILSRADVRQAVSMRQAIEVMKDAFTRLSNNEAVVPLRTHIPIDAYNGIALFMPAYVRGAEALAVKIVGVYYDNPKRGLPLIHGVVVALDAETGRAEALIEGSSLTGLRTAAGAGAATTVLARDNARVAVLFGAGVQGTTALLALCAARSLDTVYVISRNADKARAMVENAHGADGVPENVRVLENTPENISTAVRQADIIYCATTSKTPLFNGEDVKPGTHVNAVGTFTPDAREVDTVFIKKCSKIVVDAYSGALAEAGDLLIPMGEGAISEDHIYAELGELTSGRKAGRTGPDEITFFKSVGNAVQDATMAQAILKRAKELNWVQTSNFKPTDSALKGYLLIVAAAAMWGTIGIFFTLLHFEYGLGALAIGFLRAALAAIILVIALVVWHPAHLKLTRTQLWQYALFGMFGIAFFYVLNTEAVILTNVPTASVLLYTAPVFVSLIAWRLWNEPLTTKKIAAVAASFVGCILVAKAYDPAALQLNGIGVLVATLSGFTYALFTIFSKYFSGRASPWTTVTYSLVFGALFLAPLQLLAIPGFGESDWSKLFSSPMAWLLLLGLCLGPTLGSYASFTGGLRTVPASNASIVATIEPVVAAITGFLIFGQLLEIPQLAGGIIIIVSTVAPTISGDTRSEASVASPIES